MQVSVEDGTVPDEGIMCYRMLLVVFICASNLICRSLTIIDHAETDHLDVYILCEDGDHLWRLYCIRHADVLPDSAGVSVIILHRAVYLPGRLHWPAKGGTGGEST